jgi:hypothetical protein
MKTKPTAFNPPADVIRAAELLFAAKAMADAIRPIVIEYRKKALAEGQWHVRPEFCDSENALQVRAASALQVRAASALQVRAASALQVRAASASRRGLYSKDEIILNPEHDYLMSDEDFLDYHAKCDEARIAAGLKIEAEGQCPLLVAEKNVIDAEHFLIAKFSELPEFSGVTVQKLLNNGIATLRNFIELALKLMSPFVRDSKDILADIQSHQSAPVALSGKAHKAQVLEVIESHAVEDGATFLPK